MTIFNLSKFSLHWFKFYGMPLLINLNERSFFEIKKNRKRLLKKIEILKNEVERHSQMLSEYNLALERLQDFYEPTIILKKVKYFKGEYYRGLIRFSYPERHEITFKLGKQSDFKGLDDENLRTLADKLGREEIRKRFPTYFL
jgi:hypothetical protein